MEVPISMEKMTNTRSAVEVGTTSPYPMVVRVTIAQYRLAM